MPEMIALSAMQADEYETCICESIEQQIEFELIQLLKSDIGMRKCKRCGKYFIMKGNYDTNYCDRIAEGETRNCQDLAAQENYKRKWRTMPPFRCIKSIIRDMPPVFV